MKALSRSLALAVLMAAAAPACRAQEPAPKNVAILLFDDVQTIDYAAPLEIFGKSLFNTFTVAETAAPITTIHGTKVTPDYDFAHMPHADILVVPGGGKHYPENTGPYAHGLPFRDNPEVIDWVRRTAAESEIVLSVCNGAFVLGEAGLLDGLEATTTYPLIPLLRRAALKTTVRDDRRFVDNGKVITSGGLMAGIDASLHVVERVYGRGKAEQRALGLEYPWDPEGGWTRAQLADRFMTFDFQGFDDAAWTSIQRRGDSRRWENRWQVRMDRTPSEIRALVDRTLESNHVWRPMPVTWKRDGQPEAESSTSRWRFTAPDGATWHGVAEVVPVDSAPHTYEIRLRIERAG